MHVKLFATPTTFKYVDSIQNNEQDYLSKSFAWHGDITSLHAQILNPSDTPLSVYHCRQLSDGTRTRWKEVVLRPSESYRFIIAKSQENEMY